MLIHAAVVAVTLLVAQAPSERAKDVASLTNTGDRCRLNRRFDEAIAAYRQALAIDPNNVRARGGLGRVFDLTGRHADARAQYQPVAEATTPLPEYLFGELAISYVFDRRFDDAQAALERWHELNVTKRGRDQFEAAMFFDFAMARGAFDEAARLLDQQFAPIEKPAPLAPSPTLDSHALMPRLEWMRYNARRAVVAARAGRAGDAQRFMAEAEEQAGNIEDALAALTAATGADTGGLRPRKDLMQPAGEVAFWLGDPAGAIRLLANDSYKEPRLHLILGQAYEHEGNLSEARASYTRVVESPDFGIELAWARPIAEARLAAIGQ